MSEFERRVDIYRDGMKDRAATLRGLPKDTARREAALQMIEADEAHAIDEDGTWVIRCTPGETDVLFPYESRLRQRMGRRGQA